MTAPCGLSTSLPQGRSEWGMFDAAARVSQRHAKSWGNAQMHTSKSARRFGAVMAAFTLLLGFAPAALAAASGETLYNTRCKGCHEPPQGRAPSREQLAFRAPAEIVAAMTDGAMYSMALGLSAAERAAIAGFLTAKDGGPSHAATIAPVDTPCTSHPPIRPTSSDWIGAGGQLTNPRYQANPGFRADDVPRLKVKWAFSLSHANSQPVVVGDWLWIAGSGHLYALDTHTGCVHWRVDNVPSRPTPSPVKTAISPSGWAVIIGQRDRVVKAFDAATGNELWASAVLDDHRASGITGSPIVAAGQVFVPITSLEEGASSAASYPCCSFRGALVALDLATGKTQWKSRTITEPMAPIRVNSVGVQMSGPAGAAVWSQPTVDLKRGLVYVATGDSYTDAKTAGADAIQAYEMKTGKLRWNHQVTADDNFVVSCYSPGAAAANCPETEGPDYDFGASPILFTLASGKQVLLSGQKSGIAYGMDPDTGKLIWKTTVGAGSPLGGIEWGMGADTRRLYATNSDSMPLLATAARKLGPFFPSYKIGPAKPGLTALDPATGRILWHVATPTDPCGYAAHSELPACIATNSGAPAVMPGVVFAGAIDGWFRAYDSATGKVLWKFDTAAQSYATVNGVAAQPGGGMDGNGPTLAGGMLFATSGWDGGSSYGSTGVGYNVLLAFSLDGK